jgi:phosphonate C-P lyase system protein PhnH
VKNKHGFDMVHGAQEVFRILLEALSNPGRVMNIRPYTAQFAGRGRWLAPAVTLLDQGTGFYWDGDTETGEEIRFLTGAPQVSLEEADFIFLSGGGISSGENISGPEDQGEGPRTARILARIKSGTHLDPHKSALLFIASEGFNAPPSGAQSRVLNHESNTLPEQHTPPAKSASLPHGSPELSPGEPRAGEKMKEDALVKGPGVPPEGRRVRLSPGEAAWCRARDERAFEYPCGVELVFLRDDDSILALTRKTKFLWSPG